jgi:ABC-type nitrate/sulfonate/bicarbonate transport system permease component
MTTRRRWILWALEITVPVVVIALIAVWTANADSFYFPPVGDMLTAFKDTWLHGGIKVDVVPSVLRLAGGYALAVVIGISVGVLCGTSRPVRLATAPIIEFMRALPAPALIPFFILVFGVGDVSKILLIGLVTVFPVLLNTIDGIAGVDPTLLDTARSYRLTRAETLFRVRLPAASPQIFAGLRTALSLALILMVISEMVASVNGVGHFILQAQSTFDIPQMWAGILLLGILGYLLNAIFIVIERRVLRWYTAAREGV